MLIANQPIHLLHAKNSQRQRRMNAKPVDVVKTATETRKHIHVAIMIGHHDQRAAMGSRSRCFTRSPNHSFGLRAGTKTQRK